MDFTNMLYVIGINIFCWYIMYVQEGLSMNYITLGVNVLVAIISGVCLIISSKVKGKGENNIHSILGRTEDHMTDIRVTTKGTRDKMEMEHQRLLDELSRQEQKVSSLYERMLETKRSEDKLYDYTDKAGQLENALRTVSVVPTMLIQFQELTERLEKENKELRHKIEELETTIKEKNKKLTQLNEHDWER